MIIIYIITTMHLDQEEQPDNTILYERVRLFIFTSQALKKWKDLSDKSKNRYMRLRQLLITEEAYYDDLNAINRMVVKPFVTLDIITQEEALKMFNGIQSMIELSSEVSKEVSLKFQQWNPRKTTIGELMNKFAQFMLVYSDYFKNLTETQYKIKQLLRINEEAKLVQKTLSLQRKNITIDDLIIKPFQRPMKYHLILKDYFSRIHIDHPDYAHLQKAINSYHKVNNQNNLAMENKEKNSILIELDSRFGRIIQSDARYFIHQYTAFMFETPVTLYIFSDMMIIAENYNQKELIRIAFNKLSIVKKVEDGKIFQNRLYIYGKFYCIHLHFSQASIKDEVYLQFKGLIEDINKNQNTREQIISTRISRNSLELKLKRKHSYSDLEPQFVKPLVAQVIGVQKREIGNKMQSFFVIKFYISDYQFQQHYQPQYISFISKEKLLKIQQLVRFHYVNFLRINPLNYMSKIVSEHQLRSDESKRNELDCVMVNLFLNNIFRSFEVLKRIDIICKQLNIPEILWLYLKTKADTTCFCQLCLCDKYRSYEEYFQEKSSRLKNKYTKDHWNEYKQTQSNTFCQMRTIKSQQLLASLPSTEMRFSFAEHRILWIKYQLGFINHSLTNRISHSQFTKKLNIKVSFYSLREREQIEVEVYPTDRIRQIIDEVGRRKGISLDDYALEAYMDTKKYLLHDDEIIGDIISQSPQQGVISMIFSFFSQQQRKEIPLFLKKMWVLQKNVERLNVNKNVLEMEEMIMRIKHQELRLSDEENYLFYSYYYAYHNFNAIRDMKLRSFKLKFEQELQTMMPERYLKKNIVYEIFSKLQIIVTNRFTQEDLLKYIIEMICEKPGWSCVMFDAWELTEDNKIKSKLKMGCDIRGIQVRDISKLTMKYIFKFEEKPLNYSIVGDQMRLKCGQNTYKFSGANIWKIRLQVEFCHIYFTSFLI